MLDTFFQTITDSERDAVIDESASRMSDGLTFRDLVDIDRLHVTARGIVHKVLMKNGLTRKLRRSMRSRRN